MSDTTKCPACGKPITWANIEPDLGMCYSCGFQTPVCGKPMVPEMARVAAMSRIRELEARIAELEAQFKRACHVVEVNRQAKWKAENRVADLEGWDE